MAATAIDVPSSRRPNPFAFPLETTLRFVVLVVGVLGSSLFLTNWAALTVELRSLNGDLRECAPLLHIAADASLSERAASLDRFADCRAAGMRLVSKEAVAGVVVLLALAAVLYLATPMWIRWRRGLRPLDPAMAPGLHARVAELSGAAGLKRAPTIVWNPAALRSLPFVYGSAGRSRLYIGPSAIALLSARPAEFDAVIQHELAHLRNRDLPATYLSLGLWYVFVAAAITVVVCVAIVDLSLVLPVLLRAAVLALLVYVARAAVLREREFDADLRATTFDSAAGPTLMDIVERAPATGPSLRRRLLAFHPPNAERVRNLVTSDGSFGFGPLTAFVIALATSVAGPTVASIALAWSTGGSLNSGNVAAGLVGAIAGVVLALGGLRHAMARRVRGMAKFDVRWATRTASAFGLGFLVARPLALSEAVSTPWDLLPRNAAETVAWAAIGVLGFALALWVLDVTAALAAAAGRFRRSRGLTVLGVAVAAPAIGWFFGFASHALGLAAAPKSIGDQARTGVRFAAQIFDLYGTTTRSGLAVISLVVLAPLVGRLLTRGHEGVLPPWAALDDAGPAPVELATTGDTASLVGHGLLIGAAAGVAVGVALWSGWHLAKVMVGDPGADSLAIRVRLVNSAHWATATGAALAGAVMVVAGWRRLWPATLTGVVTGFVGGAAVPVVARILGADPDGNMIRSAVVFGTVIGGGTALMGAAVAMTVPARVVHRRWVAACGVVAMAGLAAVVTVAVPLTRPITVQEDVDLILNPATKGSWADVDRKLGEAYQALYRAETTPVDAAQVYDEQLDLLERQAPGSEKLAVIWREYIDAYRAQEAVFRENVDAVNFTAEQLARIHQASVRIATVTEDLKALVTRQTT
jgi:Zn-dependent protease with chaperone function